MATDYIAPDHNKNIFTCPNGCNANTQQLDGGRLISGHLQEYVENGVCRRCAVCDKYTIWVHLNTKNPKLIYPVVSLLPEAHPDMPDPLKELYEEARRVSNVSIRYGLGAFRTCVEAIVDQQGIKEKNLFEGIKKLCSKVGMNGDFKMFFELIRNVGNKSIHMKKIYTMDDANLVCKAIHYISDEIYKKPKMLKAMRSLQDKSKSDDSN